MEQQEAKKYIGIDIGKISVQISIFDEEAGEMQEESFLLPDGEPEEYIENGVDLLLKYMQTNGWQWKEFQEVYFAMEDASVENRQRLEQLMDDSFLKWHKVNVITRLRAFVEYVFHQEKVVWDRNTILFDYSQGKLNCIMIEQIRRSKQKAYCVVLQELPLEEYGITENDPELDYNFSRMMKQFLVKNPAHIIYLTGSGFEGNWMKRTLTYLCAGRRVFLGQNLYANGSCLLGMGDVPFMQEGMLLLEGADMVQHTIGVMTQETGKNHYVPITTIGKEWYNTTGSLDIIMDKSQKVDFFYHNAKENVITCATCEIKDLPARPPKTTRLRIRIEFTSTTTGVILLTDLGFGSMFPGTGKVTVFPFELVS